MLKKMESALQLELPFSSEDKFKKHSHIEISDFIAYASTIFNYNNEEQDYLKDEQVWDTRKIKKFRAIVWTNKLSQVDIYLYAKDKKTIQDSFITDGVLEIPDFPSALMNKKISEIFKYHQANIYMKDSNVIPINSKNIKIKKR